MCIRDRLHSLHWPVHRHRFPDAVCTRAIRIVAIGFGGVRVPERHPVRDRKLYRTARGGKCALCLTLRGPVLGILLDFLLGAVRRLYRRPHHNRLVDVLRSASVQPMDRRVAGWPGECESQAAIATSPVVPG